MSGRTPSSPAIDASLFCSRQGLPVDKGMEPRLGGGFKHAVERRAHSTLSPPNTEMSCEGRAASPIADLVSSISLFDGT